MLTYVSLGGFGFIFWMLAAKFYPKEDVGIATALISAMMLLTLLSRLGFDFSIVRFFPENDKSKVLNTSIIITTIFAIFLGAIFILYIDMFSPELHFLKSPLNFSLFIIFLVANSVITLIGISFVALRKAEFRFLQSLLVGSKIFFLFPLIFLSARSSFGSVGISIIITVLILLIFLIRFGIRPKFTIDQMFLKNAFSFSAGSYLTDFFITAPNYILPIMVLNVLGANAAAYYYIAFSIASLLFMIPNAISMSLFVEGSHGEALKKTVLKSLLAIFSLLTPTIIFLYFLGDFVLEIIGKDYSINGLELLRIMSFASIFVAVNYIFFSIKRIQKDVKILVLLSGLISALFLGSSYLFMLEFGLIGIGYAWVLGYGVGAVIVGILVRMERWI